MPTEPQPATVAQVVHRAVELVDPDAQDPVVADLLARYEDRDEPVAGLENIEGELAEQTGALDPDGDSPALELAAAVAVYLAHRRDELHDDRDTVLRLAARAEYDGRPPEHVADWLAAEGVEL